MDLIVSSSYSFLKIDKKAMSSTSLDIRVAGRYRLGTLLGRGSFGEIYLGTDVQNGSEVAIKLEPKRASYPQLAYEYRLYRILHGKEKTNSVGIPKVYWFGREGDYLVMVMDVLGPSLEDLFNLCGRSFSLKTVTLLAEQMIERVVSYP